MNTPITKIEELSSSILDLIQEEANPSDCLQAPTFIKLFFKEFDILKERAYDLARRYAKEVDQVNISSFDSIEFEEQHYIVQWSTEHCQCCETDYHSLKLPITIFWQVEEVLKKAKQEKLLKEEQKQKLEEQKENLAKQQQEKRERDLFIQLKQKYDSI